MSYNWDRLGILGKVKINNNPLLGGIDYQDAKAGDVLGTSTWTPPAVQQQDQQQLDEANFYANANPFDKLTKSGLDLLKNNGIFSNAMQNIEDSTYQNALKNADALQAQQASDKTYNNSITNPFLKFLTRASETAGNMATMGNGTTPLDTGNKVENFAAGIAGIPGAMLAPSLSGVGVGSNLYSGASKYLGQPVENAVSKIGDNGVSRLIANLAGQGATMGGINAGTTALQGGNVKQILNSGLQGAGQGAIFGGLTNGLGILGKSALPDWRTTFQDNLGDKVLNPSGVLKPIDTNPTIETPEQAQSYLNTFNKTTTAPNGEATPVNGVQNTLQQQPTVQPIADIQGQNMGSTNAIPMSEETYLANNGASKYGIGDAGLGKASSSNSQDGLDKLAMNQFNKDGVLIDKRNALRQEYQDKVAKGEIRPLTTVETLVKTANGNPDNESVQAARRVLEKRNIQYQQPQDNLNAFQNNSNNPNDKITEVIPNKLTMIKGSDEYTSANNNYTPGKPLGTDRNQGNTNIPPTDNNAPGATNVPIKDIPTVNTPNKYIYDNSLDYSKDNRPTDTTGIKANLPVVGENAQNFDANKSDIINKYIANRDTNKLNTNVLANDIRGKVPDVLDRSAGSAFREAALNPDNIQNVLEGKNSEYVNTVQKISDLQDQINSNKLSPDDLTTANQELQDSKSRLDVLTAKIPSNVENLNRPYTIGGKDTGYTYKQVYERALQLDVNTKEHVGNVGTFMDELGNYSKKNGTIDEMKANVMSHSYDKQDISTFNTDKLEQNRVDALDGKQSLGQQDSEGVSHNQHQYYNTFGDAIMNGKTPKTMDMADIIQGVGNDMAPKNAGSEMVRSLLSDKNALAIKPEQPIPEDYATVGQSGGYNVVMPKEYAKAFTPITDPDFITKAKIAGTITDFQNFLKTSKLGLSLFHYKNEIVAALSNGDYKSLGKTIANSTHIFQAMDDPAWRASRLDMIKTGQGMSTMISNNIDTNMKLNGSSSDFGKKLDAMMKLPVAKQVKGAIEGNNKYLFNGVMEFNKVNAYANKVAAWIGKNPSASPDVMFKAKGSIAREVNGTYGGLNWDSLGMNKTVLKGMKLGMLSPDWTSSNFDLAKMAFNSSKDQPGVTAARAFWLRSAIVGTAMLAGGSLAATGNLPNMNPKGHETDIQATPNTWVTPYGGTMGDATKWYGDVVKKGGVMGTAQFMQGKLSPILSTILGVISGRDFTGKAIAGANDSPLTATVKGLGYVAGNLSPMPFSAGPIMEYAKNLANNGTVPQQIGGGALVASGLGKYSVDTQDNKGNWLNKAFSSDPNQSAIDSINAFKSAALKNTKDINKQIQTSLKNGEVPTVGTQKQIKTQQKALDKLNGSSLQRAYGSMSKTKQKAYNALQTLGK